MQYRHELKHEINNSDLFAIRQRLRAAASPDPHAKDGKYEIRSLYFDTFSDRALREKIDGVNIREKFRIRFYDGDLSYICLEKKSKRDGLGNKRQARITAEEAAAAAAGILPGPLCERSGEHPADRSEDEFALLTELYVKMQTEGLRAKTIVDYTREPYIFAPGNVRVTFDYHIRTGIRCTDFLNPDCPMIPVRGDPIILEVKWDEYLPLIIRDAVLEPGRHAAAYSKYQACRAYG